MALSRMFADPLATRDPFDDFFSTTLWPTERGAGAGGGWLAPRLGQQQQQAIMPAMHMDVKETDVGFEVTYDAPGLRKEDIDVTFEDNVLRVQATRNEEKKEDTDRWHVQERRWGMVSRAVRLPKTANGDQIAAKYEHGVLRIHVPKAAEAETRKVIRVD